MLFAGLMLACAGTKEEQMSKPVIYQVFTRLFGNDKNVNIKNGDRTQNGCGTMSAFTPKALEEISKLGVTHIWYTGIIEHATQTDYSSFGIQHDHHAIVKGKAGSAYAIKDYYDVDPDLATSVPARMKEFEDLVRRTHEAHLKVIIDFVPNHVAREYHSDACPEGVEDLGASDDTTQHFSPKNNFYYFPGEQFHTDFDLQQDEKEPYVEQPARATGNDVFSSFANHDDWYETIKLNYGVDYLNGRSKHFDEVPSTWDKMLDILLFWAAKGIDASSSPRSTVPMPIEHISTKDISIISTTKSDSTTRCAPSPAATPMLTLSRLAGKPLMTSVLTCSRSSRTTTSSASHRTSSLAAPRKQGPR